MMEYLSFSKGGQWTLHKTLERPKDADVPGNKPYHSISAATMEGRLPEDHGQRGSMRDFGGGKRPKPSHLIGRRRWGKPHRNVDSYFADQNPGSGEQ